MLQRLTVKNFAILDDIDINFAPGLNVFSGETGAGKSIIIEALGFALGARGGASFLKEGADKMSVAAVFNSEALPDKILQEYNITGQNFTLKRELDSKGKSKSWVNANAVPSGALAGIGEYMVDFHGQHDHQSLLKASAHLDMLDHYAKNFKELAAVSKLHAKTQDIQARIDALRMSKAEKEKLLDLYSFQYKEISDAGLKPGEDIELDNALPKLKHAGKLKELAENAYALLQGGDNAAIDALSKAVKYLGDMCELDGSLDAMRTELESSLRSFEDGASTIYNYKENIDADPQTLDNLLSRQAKINKLKTKYGPEISDILETGEKLKKQIESLSFSEEKEQELQKELVSVKKELSAAAEDLHDKRVTAAKKLDARVTAEITPLGFADIKFKTDISFDEEAIGPKGGDYVEFLFSPNPGQSLRPLKNIASGGEMSRVMLGLKTVMAGGVPVMVFDEIDAGIGGATGLKVGEKLKNVSKGRQALCVTHLAQVAAFADKNFSVSKTTDRKTTSVTLDALEGERKTAEIARMLGSTKGKNSAGFEHARELLDYCKNL